MSKMAVKRKTQNGKLKVSHTIGQGAVDAARVRGSGLTGVFYMKKMKAVELIWNLQIFFVNNTLSKGSKQRQQSYAGWFVHNSD